MPRLIIDGLETEVPEGTKVIDAAEQLGIVIPRFCYLKSLGAVGACRMCAVKFLQGPFKGVQMSCMIDAQDGMVVSTTDEEATAFRRQVIEWLMLNHPHDCPVCDEGGQCLLQDETVSGGHGIRRYKGRKRTYRNQDLGVFIAHEMNRCIHCYRCSRFYQEYCGYRDLGVMQIADRVYFGRFQDGQLESPFSGNLVDICPTGVYTDIPARFKVRSWDLERSPSICIHCSLGCNTVANARYRTVWRVEGRMNEKLGSEFLCDRGRFGFAYTNHPDRPRRPKAGTMEVSWIEAIETAAWKLGHLHKTDGPQAVAVLGSARSSLETQAVLGSLCRVQCWPQPHFFVNPSTERKVRKAVARLDERVAVSMGEVADADFVLAVGVDPVNEAPMLALAMRQAHRKDAPIVVIDPRPSFLPAPHAHLAAPPADLDGWLCRLVRQAVAVEERDRLGPAARGFLDALPVDHFQDRDLEERLAQVVPELQKSRRPVLVCGTDVVGEGTPSLCADLALLLREIKGQCGLFHVMPGANAFGAALWSGSKESSFMDVVRSIEEGTVKALILVENDPFVHFPDGERLERALEKLELLVVLDHLPSRSVSMAHVFMPTSTVFEAASSFINQEGRVQWAQAVHAGGIPLHQWSGGGHPPREHGSEIPGGDPKAAWRVLWELARAMDVPGTEASPDPWAFPGAEGNFLPEGFEERPPLMDGRRVLPRKNGEAAFAVEDLPVRREERDGSLDLLVVDWSFGTEELSSCSDTVQKVEPEPHVWMQAEDAERLGFSHGDRIVLHLAGGPVEVVLKVAASMARGVLVLPRHHRLPWQKLKDCPARLPVDRVGKP